MRRVVEPFEDRLPLVNEPEPFADTELLDDVRNEDLVRAGVGTYPRRHLNGRTEEVLAFGHGFAGCEAYPDVNRGGGMVPVMPGQRLLNIYRARGGVGTRQE